MPSESNPDAQQEVFTAKSFRVYTAPNDTKSGAKIVKGRYFGMENTRESSTSFVIVVLAFQTCCNSLILEFYLNKIF